MTIRAAVALATAVSWVAAAPQVSAHAFLEHATPAVGSTVDAAPTAVQLDFSEPIEPAFSTIAIFEVASRARVEAGSLEHREPRSLSLPLPGLPPGEYEVRWKVVSVDTHETEGTFKFRVAPR